MDIYYVIMSVYLLVGHPLFGKKEELYCYCWVKAFDEKHAINIIEFTSERNKMIIKEIIHPAKSANTIELKNRKMNEENYKIAEQNGISIIIMDSLELDFTNCNLFNLKIEHPLINLEKLLKTSKKIKNKSKCLHFNAGVECDNVINAHSISKSNLLNRIARNGHVYVFEVDYFKKRNKKNVGFIDFTYKGITQVSTFGGFCKYHDNLTFNGIDNSDFEYINEQAMLYGYRSLCKEIFLKEKSIEINEERIELLKDDKVVGELLTAGLSGAKNSLGKLYDQKKFYDKSLLKKAYSDIRYVLIKIKGKPNIVFSCSYFPDVDFIGNQIQILGYKDGFKDLLSFNSVPLGTDWGFLFSWHKESHSVCNHFIRTFANIVYDNPDEATTSLFRLLMQCENFAMSPDFFEELNDKKREEVKKVFNKAIDSFYGVDNNYLMTGLNGIIDWEMVGVYQNY